MLLRIAKYCFIFGLLVLKSSFTFFDPYYFYFFGNQHLGQLKIFKKLAFCYCFFCVSLLF